MHSHHTYVRATCKHHVEQETHQKMRANVNFLYDDIVHTLQNTIDLCINSARDRRGFVLECKFTKVGEITQCNGHYTVQGHRFWYQSKAYI